MSDSQAKVYPLTRKVAAHGLAASLIAGFSGWKLSGLFGLSEWAPALAAAVVVVTLLAAEPARRHAGSTRFGPANRITLARSILVGAVAAFLGSPGGEVQAVWVTGAATLALAMDGMDGWVARRTGIESDYGASLDMELDSLLMLILSLLAWQWGLAGIWVLFCGLARYGFLIAGKTWPWFDRPLPPAFRRKTCCVIGIGGLTACMWPWPWSGLGTTLAATATLALAVSFTIDTYWLIQRRKEPVQ